MAFQRGYSKEEVEAFAESVKGESVYFKAGDIEEDGTRIRVIPWVYDGRPIDILMLTEGWQDVVDPKTKAVNPQPIRFDFGAKIPETGIKWSVGQSFDGKPGHAQTPKSAVCFLFYLVKKQAIKVATFTQAGLVKPISDMLDQDKETFLPDFSKVDIILTAKQEKGKKGKTYGVTVAANNRGSGPYPDGYVEAIRDFAFSMEEFMACKDPFAEGVATKGAALASMFKDTFEIDLYPEQSKGQAANKVISNAKAETPAAKPAAAAEAESAWKSFTTPKGRKLGDMTIDELKEAKAKLDGMGKTDLPIYSNIVKGIEEITATPASDAEVDF